ncbi:hypothetical protein [Haliangium ochraceum]|nr:hypothetical protein [Haliangium ochraceum]
MSHWQLETRAARAMAQACGGGLEIVAVAVRLGVVVLVVMGTLAGPAQAQSAIRAGDVSQPALVHQDEVTGLVYPDKITRVQPVPEDVLLFEIFENRLYVLPKKGTAPGTEVMLEVETRAQRLILWVLVVKQVQDADKRLIVLAPGSPYGDEPDMRRELASSMYEGAEGWETSVAADAGEAEAADGAGAEAAAEDAAVVVVDESENASEPAPTEGQPFELSVHALGGLGVMELGAQGLPASTSRRSYAAMGGRLSIAPPESWWAVEADVGVLFPDGPFTYQTGGAGAGGELSVAGPLVRGLASLRMRTGTTWIPSAFAGVGMQAHLRTVDPGLSNRRQVEQIFPRAVVWAFGVGLQHRTCSDWLLGFDVVSHQGGPDEYFSVAARFSVGRFLTQRE